MAKIAVTFDTVSKEFVVTMDKKPVEYVNYVSFMPKYMGDGSYGEMMCTIQTKSEDEKNDVCEYKSITAEQVKEPIQKYLESCSCSRK